MNDEERSAADAGSRAEPEHPMPDRASADPGQLDARYTPRGERALGAAHPSGEVNAERASSPERTADAGADIPPDNGKRASFDSRTGEVHGSGAGAGGGNPGEDFDSDSATGDGYPQTGGEGRAAHPSDLGPPRLTE